MDITAFTVDADEGKEVTHRVLVYPNITYQHDLERDSNTVMMRNVMRYLSKRFPLVEWTLLQPSAVSSLTNIPNVRQAILPLPSYPNTMRTHFDASTVLKLLDWRNQDWDIIYSILPEHTAQLANVCYNATNLTPKIVGYCNWFEVPENTAYEKTMLWANMAGILEMEECGVNSEWLKQLMLDHFSHMVSGDTLRRLDAIIQPHYLGVDAAEVNTTRIVHEPRSVVFNHRPNEYTGWNWFVEAMDELWRKRQDFKVYLTLASIDRPWAESVKCKTRKDYLDFLHTKPQFGVGCFQKYSAWSISTTDGLSQGVPYLLPDGLCYPELVPSGYPFLYASRKQFASLFGRMLDGMLMTSEEAASWRQALASYMQDMVWDSTVSRWFGGWNGVLSLTDLTLRSRTDGYLKVRRFIEQHGSVSKKDILKHMNWGAGIRWSPYRHMLRTEPHIKLTRNRYEVRA